MVCIVKGSQLIFERSQHDNSLHGIVWARTRKGFQLSWPMRGVSSTYWIHCLKVQFFNHRDTRLVHTYWWKGSLRLQMNWTCPREKNYNCHPLHGNESNETCWPSRQKRRLFNSTLQKGQENNCSHQRMWHYPTNRHHPTVPWLRNQMKLTRAPRPKTI